MNVYIQTIYQSPVYRNRQLYFLVNKILFYYILELIR